MSPKKDDLSMLRLFSESIKYWPAFSANNTAVISARVVVECVMLRLLTNKRIEIANGNLQPN